MSRLLLALSLITVVSCEPKSTNSVSARNGAAIMNGTDVKDSDAILSSIVAIYNDKEGYLCTGSIIAPNIILTAAHCISGKPSDMRIVFGTNMDEWLNAREPDVQAEHIRHVSDMKINEDYTRLQNAQMNTHDIALMKFKGTLPEGYKPATFLADQTWLKRGTTVTVAGYGVNLVDQKPLDPKKYPGNKLEQAIEAGEVVCDATETHCNEVEMKGDGILRQTQAPIASLQESEVRLNESNAGTCAGDSGGPAYILKDGVFYLFGITSRGSGLCDGYGVYTNAVEFQTWINDTIKTLH